MNPLPGKFRSHCLDAALNLLWRQWCSLGVAGHARAADPNRIIDPEALLLATTSLGRHDPRLFDECLDWLSRYGSLFHLQRLKTLQMSSGLGDPVVLSAMADWLVQSGGQPKWKAHARPEAHSRQEKLFFIGRAPVIPDPVFAEHGLLRPPVKVRGMSRSPNPMLPPNILITLRALIGVSARAEVILCLASGPAAHPSEIARLTGYTPRTMQALLQEMALSGHILTQEHASRSLIGKGRGPNRRYHLREADWRFLTGGTALPRWTPWAPLWSLTQTVLDAIPAPDTPAKHPAIVSSKIRDHLAVHGQSLAAAGLLPVLNIRSGSTGEDLLESLVATLPDALTMA